MRNKPKSAPALLWFLSFSVLSATAGRNVSAQFQKPRNRANQGGRDASSKSDASLTEVVDLTFPEDYIRNASSPTPAHSHLKDNFDAVNKKPCNLTAELLKQMKSAGESEWIIDNSALDILDNDPEKLIQCTHPGDRVTFELTGAHKFKQTLVAFQELEFFSKSLETDSISNATRRSATFTCPDGGPFLSIKSSGFSANGFVIQNCTSSSGEGAIDIQSNSTVSFKNTEFSGNRKRAIYVASNASLTLEICNFENNGDWYYDGGAILVLNNVSLSIASSSFYGNNASYGGAIHGNNSVALSILSSDFSKNNARRSGGAINLNDDNNLRTINMTLSGNNAQGSGGAMDLSSKNNLTLTNVTLSCNNAQGFGGAINLYCNNSLTLTDTTLSWNNADSDGGAIDLDDNNSLIVTNTTISGNSAQWSGGAIYLNDNNNLTITSANLTGNSAQGFAGAIDLNDYLKLFSTTLSGNHEVWYGGAIRLSNNNNLTIIDTTLSGNNAQGSGGAIELSNHNNLSIIHSTLSGNSAQGSGGAINLNDNNNLKLINTNLSWNLVGWYGGAIDLNDDNNIKIINTTLSRNCAMEGFGGAIEVSDNNNFKIINTSLVGNSAKGTGGAIYLLHNNNLNITNTILSRNNAKRSGGAIEVLYDNNVAISNTTLSGNSAAEGFGGAIELSDNNNLRIVNTTLSGNIAQGSGGAIQLHDNNKLTVTKTTLFENKAQASGGAIDLSSHNNSLTIIKTTLSRNVAQGSGGAVYLSDDNNFQLVSATLSGNSAQASGGAISLNNNNLTITNTTLSGNKAQGSGGAIELSNNNNLKIIDTSISGNSAQGYGGAINFFSNNNLTITKTTLSGNNASDGGAISLSNNNHLTITSATLSGNNARSTGGAISLYEGNILNVTNTLLSRNQAENNGAAVSLTNDNTLTLRHTTFSENYASLDGGAIFSKDKNTLTLIRAKFSRNQASRDGGALRLYDSNHLSLLHTTFSQNSAIRDGGAVRLSENNNVVVANSTFCENKGKVTGGALSVDPFCSIGITNSSIIGNSANQGGAILSGEKGVVSFNQSKFERNIAKFGGCFYGESLSLEVHESVCRENLSSKKGGCFYLKSSNATFEGSHLSQNQANESGGGVYMLAKGSLHITSTSIASNLAKFGGGVALLNGSRLLSVSCSFENNSASQGGGLYIMSNARSHLLAQLTMSSFQRNRATNYGGGMVVKTFKIKTRSCTNFSTMCDRIILHGTSFMHNSANVFGSSIVGTKPDNILVSCQAKHFWPKNFTDIDMIRTLWKRRILKSIDPKELCKSWENDGHEIDTRRVDIGTFGHTFDLTTNSTLGAQVVGNHSFGFVLKNVKSGQSLPNITIGTLDAFGNSHAPALLEGKALTLNSSDGSFQPILRCAFENGSCTITNLIGFVLRNNYMIHIYPRNDDVLKATNLLVVVRECVINEESASDGNLCRECGETSYNFDVSPSGKCAPCPENANCTTRYIKPKDGYWHHGPCHAKVKRCIVEEACEVQGRIEKLSSLAQEFDDCNISNAMLANYSHVQCQEGYKGPLCGSCKKSYGLSSKFECSKCGNAIIIVLRFLGAVVYLLIGTIITIKGVLPSNSSQQGREDVETSLLEHDNTTFMDVASSSQVREEVEVGIRNPSETMVEEDENPLNSCSQEVDEIEVTKLKLICLNYFQVTSTAAGMDVEWTKKILDMLKSLNVLGAATTDSISYSFDCLFSSSSSNDVKAIWRLVFSLVVPLIVILLLSLYWGYKSMTKHGGDWIYFLRRLTLTIITVTYATYFDLTRVAMRTFSCVAVHTNTDPFSNAISTYWVADTSIECYENTHIVLICISLIVVTLVTIGFPTFSSFTLNKHKSEVRDTSSWTHDTLGFLGGPFKQRFIYWECVTMIKKAILSVIIVFSYSLEVQSQGLLILLVLVFFLYVHFLTYPYDGKYHSLNYYESGSLLVSCVTYTLVQFFSVERCSEVVRSLVSLSIITINVGFVCLMAYKIIKDLAQLLKALLRSQNIHVPKNMNVISLIRVYSIKRRVR